MDQRRPNGPSGPGHDELDGPRPAAQEAQRALLFGGAALTYDDVLVVPGYSEVLPAQVEIATELAPGLALALPLVSSPMDRVTEAPMAAALALAGGLGVVHRNQTDADQAAQVSRVKRHQSGVVTSPLTVTADTTVVAAEDLAAAHGVSGLPVVDATGQLAGICTRRDLTAAGVLGAGLVSEVMTTRVVTAPADTSPEQAKAVMARHRIEKLPLVDAGGRLVGMITTRDALAHRDHPLATLDRQGRLRVAAAVGVGAAALARAEALVDASVDAVVVDTAHGHSAGVLATVRSLRAAFPELVIVAGNVVTAEGVAALAGAGASAVRVGVGPGSICTTRVVAGAGMPQLSAIWECSGPARRLGLGLIADGGISASGDITKALAVGADAVMVGNLLAGTDESPGEVELADGRRWKSYRGMGAAPVLAGLAADRYASSGPGSDSAVHVPEGVEGRVPYVGPVAEVLAQLMGGLRSGMGYAGAADLADLRRARLVQISPAGRTESHPHHLVITREAPNYQR